MTPPGRRNSGCALVACAILLCLAVAGCGQTSAPSKSAAPAAARPSTGAPKAPAVAKAPSVSPAARATPKAKSSAAAPADAPPTGGVLHIDSDVSGAFVFIDRQYVGVTPVTAPNVSPGTHQLNISAQGYSGIAQSVDVEPGPRDFMFKFKEVRLDAAIDVVHKHRIGSCTGRLVATPQGISYDATDKGDAFTVPLTDLDRFDVDYLAKTLHVKLASGKQYDFNDPDGNADHLFVFHRDVDAARKKLLEKP
jgi:hypothetical protein